MIKAMAGEIYETPSKEIKEFLIAKATNNPTIPDKNIMTKKYGKLKAVFL